MRGKKIYYRAGVAAWLDRRAETAKGQAGWPEYVGSFAINRRSGLRGLGRDACLQFRPRTLGDPWRHPGLRSWTAVRSGKSRRPSRKIAPDHIELSADDGWDLLIETDREGRLAQETHVGFPVKLGGRPLKFNCRPADPTVGFLHTLQRARTRMNSKAVSNWKSLSARMLSPEKLPRGPTNRSRFVGTSRG